VKEQRIQGYVKPVFTDLVVARIEEDLIEDRDNPIIFSWEVLTGFVASFLESPSLDRFATIIPITGTLESPDFNIWEAVGNAFENAYGNSIASGLENNTNLKAGFEEDEGAYLQKLEKSVHNSEPVSGNSAKEENTVRQLHEKPGPPSKVRP